MLKKLGLVTAAPLLCLAAVLILTGFAFRPLPTEPPLVVVLNGGQLSFPQDLPKLAAEEARIKAEVAATVSALSKAYPADGKPACPAPAPPYGAGCQ